MKMTILERDDGITHVVLTGRLDTTGSEDIGDAFSEATSARAGQRLSICRRSIFWPHVELACCSPMARSS